MVGMPGSGGPDGWRGAGHATRGDELRLTLMAFRPVDDPEALVLVQTPVRQADHALVARLVGRAREGQRALPITGRSPMRRVGGEGLGREQVGVLA
ncbi:hypothetical protein FAGKG844_640004 [Frankia sp. AgKG'84/4]